MTRRRTKAFTLLELLLATALLTVLMGGIIAIITDFARAKTARAAALPRDLPLNECLPLLEADLLHAHSVDVSRDNRLSLSGYAALTGDAPARNHRPVTITYELETAAGMSCLVRRQALLDDPTSQNTRRDLVLAGISRFSFKPSTGELTLWKPGSDAPALVHTFRLAGGGS